MILLLFTAVLATAFAAWRAWRRLRFFLHLFQLEGYKPNEYRHWIAGRLGDVVFRHSHGLGLMVLALGYAGFSVLERPSLTAPLLLFLWAVTFASSRRYRSEQQKKPLAYTARLRRLLGTAAALTLLPVLVGALLGGQQGTAEGWLYYLGGWLLADLGAPLWVLLAAYLMKPVERHIQNGFKRQAQARLQDHRALTVVGITGSYGKTSTKFAIAELLRQRYNVHATPSSFNTPMGICIVVNNQLKPEHQVLVLEMGARYRGDIQELCELAPPDIAVVTTVGVAHLETMGPIENIALEKGDIVRYAKPGAPVVLNMDNQYVAAMAAEATGPVWRVSVEGHPEADITAHDITYGPEGARFTVRDDTGAEAVFQTRLLGQHNVLNILLGVGVGRALDLRLRQMAHAARRLEPVAHRLALRQEGPITVIDDAFNANPVGARNAVEILGQFTTGRRVIVTPGMIELGPRQEEENRTLGRHIAQHTDLAVLVGQRQTAPIQAGLQDEGYPEAQVQVVGSLFEARRFLKTYLQPGDVVLYENDLPDQYDE